VSPAAPAPDLGPARRPSPSRPLRLLVLGVGLAFIAWLLWDLGPATVWRTIHALGWRLAVVMFIPFSAAIALDTLGWRVLLPGCRVGWAGLVGARLAGEAVNLATPTASVGGEPLKAYLVRDRVALDLGLASVIVDKTSVVMGQAGFLAGGLGLAVAALAPPRELAIAMAVLLVAESIGAGGFALVQLHGGVAGAGRILQRLGVGPAASYHALLLDVDRRLAELYRERWGRVLASALLHAGGWAIGGLEIYVVLSLAGIPVDLATSCVLEAVSSAVRFATFMIPGSLGALEGGNVAAFAAFGLSGAAGLSFSLVRRLREATWAVIGLAALAGFKARPAGPTTDRPSAA
jgi:uncharacterized membrane protein YbhN (UPF0104 family)